MEADETIIATPAADVAIVLGPPGPAKRVRVLANSAILRNSSPKFDALLGEGVNNIVPQDGLGDLPDIFLPGDYQVDGASMVLRYLHHDSDDGKMPDGDTILDMTMFADDYDALPSLGPHLQSIILARIVILEDAEELCFLLLAASIIKAANAFRIVSAKMIRISPILDFHRQFDQCFGIKDYESEISAMLDKKRRQIDHKVVERLSPALKPCECDCMSDGSHLDYIIRREVTHCMDVKDRRTPQERLELMDMARKEIDRDPCPLLPESSAECMVPLAMRCLGHAIQDIRTMCSEGLSLADVERERAKNARS